MNSWFQQTRAASPNAVLCLNEYDILSSGGGMCGVLDGDRWRPDAALFDADWNVTPIGQTHLDLVFGEWWIDESLTTKA